VLVNIPAAATSGATKLGTKPAAAPAFFAF